MKKLLLIAALGIVLVACKKEQSACEVGDSCLVNSDIFNNGAFQPVQPLKANSTYIDGATHLRYLIVTDQQNIKWYFPQGDLYSISK